MNVVAPAWLILLISAGTDFIITFSATLTGAMVANGTIALPTPAVWLFAFMLGLAAAGKETRSQLKLPIPGDHKVIPMPPVVKP
jgi:hypothetical protein